MRLEWMRNVKRRVKEHGGEELRKESITANERRPFNHEEMGKV